MLRAIIIVLFVLDAVALTGIILLQMSRHAGLGGAFGAGGRYTVFGRDETKDPKRTATAWLAGGFLFLGFLLSIIR
ncbi:MAG: preprotein translocase subunit SecG [Candidatus Acetothermia bacterium]|jgi:protein translocase SecG subunit|nr:preprotein translocase subunit SecG [Candidatus Acetothermia bacterium]MDH7505831.1 preprotein translocase subunit SecG [Candidatus Acetothermia bacterium]